MEKIIDGKKIQEEILKDLKKKFDKIQKNRKIQLSVFVVGENEVIDSFVRIKEKVAKKLNISFVLKKYNFNISEAFLISEIKKENKKTNGIIVQLPLPKKFNEKKILNSIDENKDVDLLSDRSWEKFSNIKKIEKNTLVPPVAGAVWRILENKNENPDIFWKNKKVLVLGAGKLVGQPVSFLFKKKKIPFDNIDLSYSENEKNKKILNADLIISGTGNPNLIKNDMIKKNVFLIDAGTSTFKGVLKGDISIECLEKASFFLKTPGGVGPITVAILFENLLKLNS